VIVKQSGSGRTASITDTNEEDVMTPELKTVLSKFHQRYGQKKRKSSSLGTFGGPFGKPGALTRMAAIGSLATAPTALGAIGGGIIGGPFGAVVGAGLGALGTGIAARIGLKSAAKAAEKEKQDLEDYYRRMELRRARTAARPGPLGPKEEPLSPEEEEEEEKEKLESTQWPSIGDDVMIDLPEGSFLGKVLDVKGDTISVDVGEGDLVDVNREQVLSPDVKESVLEHIESEEDVMKVIDEVVRQDVLKL
jgi:hypothetical protein